jgi:hypothetical protein
MIIRKSDRVEKILNNILFIFDKMNFLFNNTYLWIPFRYPLLILFLFFI